MWLRNNWRWALLNVSALAIMLTLLVQYANYTERIDTAVFSPTFEYGGKWATRFLLLCLAMTPLNTLFGWRWALKLRKSAGLWAFGFAALHFLTYTQFRPFDLAWLGSDTQIYIVMGLAALFILSLMAITSNQRAMRWLGKSWKRLHRLVYSVGLLVTIHAILAFANSKKRIQNEAAMYEFYLYLVLLIVLLALRLPFVKDAINWLKRPARVDAVGSKTS
jgi:sulfoxide reductase heme-binding subunit YedZ